jgi:hypothetical protein
MKLLGDFVGLLGRNDTRQPNTQQSLNAFLEPLGDFVGLLGKLLGAVG